MIAFLRRLLSNYESLAERAGIGFVLNFPKACLSAYFDADKLTKIVGNLVDNAIKYTPARGTVNVSVKCTESRLIVIIKDTGSGISSGEIEHIFDRFYRVAKTETEGSGIGLALVKELVDVYQGSISVSSTLGKGSTFRINLPHSPPDLPSSFIVRENNESTPAFSPDTDILVSLPATHDKRSGIEEQPLILIVEDHADLRQLLVDLLTVNYRVLTAKDGHHGERMAIEHLPELIISDVMMPGQDGYALCNSLKSNPKTSHIPLILLTARAGRQDTIAGLTQGADDYLTKPFDGKELLLRVKNLLLTRRRLWEYFQSKDLTLLPGGIDERSLDDQFIQTLAGTIIDHLANDALNVDMLARAVGFSQSQLTRKLRALTNKTPNQLITEMRLHEAHRQLELKSGSVSEIAYLVGYTSPSYFTRRFQQHFGYPPSSVKVASPDE